MTDKCVACKKKDFDGCARIECPSRRSVTATIPDGSTREGFISGGSCRLGVMTDLDYIHEFERGEKCH